MRFPLIRLKVFVLFGVFLLLGLPRSASGQCRELTAADADDYDYFGESVGLDGDRVVVGAAYNNDLGANSGSAYVFRRGDNGTPADPSDDFWVQEAKLLPADAGREDHFGNSVSIDGDRVIVGALFDDDTGEHSGSA